MFQACCSNMIRFLGRVDAHEIVEAMMKRGIIMDKQSHELLREEQAVEASRLLKAISDPTRIRILHLLSQEECSVGHIAEVLGMSQSAVSHQLSHLRSLRLVKYRRDGNTYYYTYEDEHVIGILHQVLEHISH